MSKRLRANARLLILRGCAQQGQRIICVAFTIALYSRASKASFKSICRMRSTSIAASICLCKSVRRGTRPFIRPTISSMRVQSQPASAGVRVGFALILSRASLYARCIVARRVSSIVIYRFEIFFLFWDDRNRSNMGKFVLDESS